MTDKKVLTFQDISCLGQCSLTVALPIISACGIETIILPSAVLSTHTGCFPGYTFHDLTEDIPGIINHWKQSELSFDCLYTGYLGSMTQIEYAKDLRKSVISSDGLFIVDPVMADDGRLYSGFTPDFVKEMAGLCAEADIILPNITEACFMTGTEPRLYNHDEEYVTDLIDRLSDFGASKIILKGICFEPNKIGVAIKDNTTNELSYYFTDKNPKNSPGTGDCYASAFVGSLISGLSLYDSAALAADFVLECIKKTADDSTHTYGVKFEKALPMLINRLNV